MTAPTMTRESWARDLLTRMGYPVTDNNMTSVLAWEYQEGGHFNNSATFNPLNTTRAHATYGEMNGAHVSTYPDYETGMDQTVRTLNLGAYSKIRDDLQADADPATTAADIKASPWGTWHAGSPNGDVRRAAAFVAAHPTTVTPVPAPNPSTGPAPGASPTPVPQPAPEPAANTSGSFEGADVDALDKLAREFQQAAQICDEVRMACEVIVAAASFFGPFGAAFVAYLKGTVIPWLKKISEALTLMAQVLSQHSQAQKQASSSTTSPATYVTPGGLPDTNTGDYPTMSATPTGVHSVATETTSYLGGWITVGQDSAGRVVDVGVGPSTSWFADHTDYHLDRDAAGDVRAVTSHGEQRIGSVTDPLTRSTVDTSDRLIKDANGATIGLRSSYSENASVDGVPVVRLAATGSYSGSATDPNDFDVRGGADLVIGPGTGENSDAAGALPGGARLPEMPGGDGTSGFTWKPPELSLGASVSSGSYGDSVGASLLARVAGADLHGGGQDGLLAVGAEGKGDIAAGGGFFLGSNHFEHQTTTGVFGNAGAGISAGVDVSPRIGTEHTYVLGTGGASIGVPGGFDLGAFAIEHGPDATPSYDLGAHADVTDAISAGGRIHHDTGGE